MKLAQHHLLAVGAASLFSLLALNIAGCAQTEAEIQVVVLGNQDRAALNAYDIVCILRRAGFSDDQVLECGTDVRNSLALTGSAKIIIDDTVEAILAVDGDYLHVASRQTGSFIYDLKKQQFR